MEYTQIDIESKLEGKLKIAYLNQPESYNSLNKKMLSEIRHFMEECDKDEKVRCIAISGRGKAFCSGQNLKEALALGKDAEEERIIQRMVIDYYNPMVKSIVKIQNLLLHWLMVLR